MTVNRTSERVRKMFGEIAGHYDFLNHFLSVGIDRWWRRVCVRTLRPEAGNNAPLLDVCTGTGDLAIAFWKRYHLPVVGTDFCPEMLRIGRTKCEKLGIWPEQLDLCEADTTELPFDDGRFQIVTVAFGLRNVEDTDRGLSEMYRVCQPGGRVGILEFTTPQNPLIRWGYQLYFRHILPLLGQCFARNRSNAYHYLPQSVGEFPQRDALVQLMTRAGFRNVTYRSLTFGIAALYVGEKGR